MATVMMMMMMTTMMMTMIHVINMYNNVYVEQTRTPRDWRRRRAGEYKRACIAGLIARTCRHADTQQGFQLASVSVRDRGMQESSELSHVQKSETPQHTQQGFQLAHVKRWINMRHGFKLAHTHTLQFPLVHMQVYILP